MPSAVDMTQQAETIRPKPARKNASAKGSRYDTRRHWIGFLFVVPSLILVGLFFLLPLFLTFWMSLHQWPLMGERTFIGLDNYKAILHDDDFWRTLMFTLKYTVVVTVAIFAAAFPLALYVEHPRRSTGILRTCYFTPAVIGLASASLLWVWLLNTESGLFSEAALRLGLTDQPINFLTDVDVAFWSIIIMVVWKVAGFTMLLLLTGLQSIPTEIQEAARIDGAGPFQRFRLVTLPLMRRTLAMTLVMSIAGSVLAFDQFYIITNAGPQNQTMTAVYLIMNTSFVSFNLGYGSALSIVLLLILMGFSLIQLYLLRTKEGQ